MSDQKKIFIVDDTEEHRELLAEVLEDEGYLVETSDNGKNAVDLLLSGKYYPDLILMDMTMEGMDGPTAFNIIKSNEKLEKIPFIFVTGRDRTETIFQSHEVDDFIVKPFDLNNLVARIKKVIERKPV